MTFDEAFGEAFGGGRSAHRKGSKLGRLGAARYTGDRKAEPLLLWLESKLVYLKVLPGLLHNRPTSARL